MHIYFTGIVLVVRDAIDNSSKLYIRYRTNLGSLVKNSVRRKSVPGDNASLGDKHRVTGCYFERLEQILGGNSSVTFNAGVVEWNGASRATNYIDLIYNIIENEKI